MEQEELAEAPQTFVHQRRALIAAIEAAEADRREASDARALGETRLAESDRAARSALEAMSAAREQKARSEAQLEAARQRAADIDRAISQELETTPQELVALAGVAPGAELPESL